LVAFPHNTQRALCRKWRNAGEAGNLRNLSENLFGYGMPTDQNFPIYSRTMVRSPACGRCRNWP